MLRIVAADQPPTRLLLGPDALQLVQAGRDAFERDMPAWAELSASTDFARRQPVRLTSLAVGPPARGLDGE